MTLFGQTLDSQQLFGLVSLIGVLVLWLFVYRGERDYARWFKQWEADRRARRLAEEAGERGEGPSDGPPRGPWG